jgi:hypothetical protein
MLMFKKANIPSGVLNKVELSEWWCCALLPIRVVVLRSVANQSS